MQIKISEFGKSISVLSNGNITVILGEPHFEFELVGDKFLVRIKRACIIEHPPEKDDDVKLVTP